MFIAEFMSNPAEKPYHIVPPSIVVNTRISTPEVVRSGADDPAQSTEPGQFTVCDPPLVKIKVNDPEFAEAGGLLKVKVVVPVSTVPLTTFPFVRSIS